MIRNVKTSSVEVPAATAIDLMSPPMKFFNSILPSIPEGHKREKIEIVYTAFKSTFRITVTDIECSYEHT